MGLQVGMSAAQHYKANHDRIVAVTKSVKRPLLLKTLLLKNIQVEKLAVFWRCKKDIIRFGLGTKMLRILD